MRVRLWAVVAILMVAGCRRGVGEDSPKPLLEDRTGVWYPEGRGPPQGDRPNLGPIDGEVLVRQVGEGPPQSVNIRIEPEDTLELFVRWTGRPLEDLFRWNPEVRERGLVPGEFFRLVLTPGEFDRFSGTRKAYLAEARALREMGREIAEVVTHTVSDGETLKDILERYPTSLDLMEKLNPRLRLTGIRPGQVLRIPLLTATGKETPALPGPRPPAPPPVPVPPDRPKPQTVQPATPLTDPAPVQVADVTGGPSRTPVAGVVEYVVQPGDTAWVVARHRFKVGVEELARANPGVDLDRLRPGMTLRIPRSSASPGQP